MKSTFLILAVSTPFKPSRFIYLTSYSNLVVENIIERIPPERRMDVNIVLDQVKSSFPQKRALLIKQGLSRALIDEIEVLSESSRFLISTY